MTRNRLEITVLVKPDDDDPEADALVVELERRIGELIAESQYENLNPSIL